MNWILYGATGYTGALIAREAAARGLAPVLSGRSAPALERLASELGLVHRVAPLDDAAALASALQGTVLVLHCAGPFSRTGQPMRDACLAAGVHYLDITGEIDVFKAAHRQHAQAAQRGVLLCPGVGFDVVPTDCLAARLKAALPDASHLDLGFSGVDRLSAGTLVTSMEAVHRGCARVRQGGVIIDVPFGQRGRTADFGRGPEPSFVVPWGDVATAFYTTGIPDIAVHIPRRAPAARAIRSLLPVRRLLAGTAARRLVHPVVRALAGGPSRRQRMQQTTRVWGEVRNAGGDMAGAVLEGPEAYAMTVQTALLAVEHVLRQQLAVGYMTPSQLLGWDSVERFGCRIVPR